MADQLSGGCLCGGVRYTVAGEVKFMARCHCSQCRKFSGAAYSQNIVVEREQLTIAQGEDLLRAYRCEDRKDMVFCSRCGSSVLVISEWPAGAIVRIRAGTLDGDPGVRPIVQAFVDFKAPWCAITDDVPQLATSAGG